LSWTLSASGHADDLATEQKIAARIGEVLAQAGDAVSYASFGGGGFSGDPRGYTNETEPVSEASL
jgi:hypothetical protein